MSKEKRHPDVDGQAPQQVQQHLQDEEDRLWAEALQQAAPEPAPSLHDLAAELVQLDDRDKDQVRRISRGFRRLSEADETPEQARTFIERAADKLNRLARISGPDARCALLEEVGLLVEAASDMIDAAPGSPSPELEAPAAEEAGNAAFQSIPEDADPVLMSEFVAEGHEAIEAAEAALLDLEGNPEDMEDINTVFRSFHTIKGTPAFLGLDRVSRLAHLAENLFQRVRDRHIDCVGGFADLALHSDALTTNKTSFFREEEHFRFLRQVILPSLQDRPSIRMWSAGCSTGEEPLSMAMLLRRHFADVDLRDIRLLATDLSTQVLARARQGCFAAQAVSTVPKAMRVRYLEREKAAFGDVFRAKPEILDMVAFARLNLIGHWPMKGPFQVIFCRNVMIYFDKPTQQRLVGRFARLLEDGGYLFIGHSESLSGLSHPYRFVQPAIYRKAAAEGAE